jgi:hypothetical protein
MEIVIVLLAEKHCTHVYLVYVPIGGIGGVGVACAE